REQRLDGIDDEGGWLVGGRGGEHGLEIGLAQERDISRVAAETVRAKLHLKSGLFAGGIQRSMTGTLESSSHLQQQRRLSDPRFTADEDHRTRYDPAAEGEVELLQARVPAFRRGAADVAELRRRRDAPAFRQRARAAKAPRRASGARGDARRERFLDE